MAEGRIKNTELSAIAAAIRSKNGESTVYKPAEMAQAILDIPTGGSAMIESKSITANGTYTAPTGVDGYNPVTVNVPNSYSQSDEGKVVSNGALVSQTARSGAITQNGTYDTTNNNEVTVNVSSGTSVLRYANQDETLVIIKDVSSVTFYFNGFVKSSDDLPLDNVISGLPFEVSGYFSSYAYDSDKTTRLGAIGFNGNSIRSWSIGGSLLGGTFWGVVYARIVTDTNQANPYSEPPSQ